VSWVFPVIDSVGGRIRTLFRVRVRGKRKHKRKGSLPGSTPPKEVDSCRAPWKQFRMLINTSKLYTGGRRTVNPIQGAVIAGDWTARPFSFRTTRWGQADPCRYSEREAGLTRSRGTASRSDGMPLLVPAVAKF